MPLPIIRSLCIVIVSTTLLCTAAQPQDRKAFEEAESKTGCESIPYSTQQSACTDRSRDVDDWCKNSSRPRSCQQLDLKAISTNIDRITSKKKEVEDQKSRATTDDDKRSLQDQIDKLSKSLEALSQQLSEDKREVEKRIDYGEHCRDYRGKVQAEFFEASRKADGENDPDIKPIAQRLKAKWKDGMIDHVVEYQKAVDALQICKDQLRY